MAVQTAVSVIIGAELGGTFKGAFGDAKKQLGTLGSAIKGLNSTSDNITAFRNLGRETTAAGREWKNAEAKLKGLAAEIAKTDKPSKALQANFRQTQKEAALAKNTYTQNRTALAQMSEGMRKAGIDTKNLTTEQSRLGKALDTLRARQTALAAVQSKQQANLAARSHYRSQIMDVVALGGSLHALIKPAIDFESAMADVKKVVDFDDDADVKRMEAAIKNMAKTIPLTLQGLTQIVAAGGQMGIAKENLTTFAETAAKMSVAFGITADEAGQSMSELANVLGMSVDQMNKVGDAINHLSNNMAAAAPNIIEATLRAGPMAKSFGLAYNETSALAATFVAMGRSPQIAGSAITMMVNRLQLLPTKGGEARAAFDQLGLSMQEYIKLVESGKGKEAILQMLEALTKVKGIKRSQIMVDIFGEQANKHISSLVENLDTLRKNFALVGKEVDYAGSMEDEFVRRSQTTENNIVILKNQLAILATNVGTTLLPAINSVVSMFGKAAASLASFAEKHPTLVKYIGMAVAGLASAKIAGLALGYGFTFLKGGVLAIISIFTKARTAFSLLRLGLGGIIPIIKAVGVAFASNPIGLAITGIVVGAALIIKYWKPISAFFKNLFAPVVAVFKQVWQWVTNLWEKAKNIFNGIKEWVKDSWVGKAWNWAFGGDDDTAPAKVGGALANENMSLISPNPTELTRGSISNANMSSVSVNAPITINASPGMSESEVAKQVSRELDAREQAAGRRARGVNYD